MALWIKANSDGFGKRGFIHGDTQHLTLDIETRTLRKMVLVPT